MSDDSELDMQSYLSREGAIGVLVRLDVDGGLINKELENLVHVSPTTLASRLKEGIELDLLTVTIDPDDHGNAQRYQLTKRGEELLIQLASRGMDTQYEQFFEAHQQLTEKTAEVQDWLATSNLTDPRWPPDREHEDTPPGT
jgi:DNA-binding HxlR family transcriptional regulator